MSREGVWNRFERDRGVVSCGDCGEPVGWRIDTDPGTAVLLCDLCYEARHEAPPIAEPKGAKKGGERGRGKEEG